MRSVLLISTLFISQFFYGQQALEVRGLVHDVETGKAVADCHISLVGGDVGAVSDAAGYFFLSFASPNEGEVIIRIEHVAYSSKQVKLAAEDMGDGALLHIGLKPLVYSLEPVEVLSERMPEIVYASEQHSIADYEFIGDSILLLAYEKRLERASKIYLLNADLDLLDSIQVPYKVKAIGLERDYADNVYLRAHLHIYQIAIGTDGLECLRVDAQNYEEQVVPIVTAKDEDFLFHTFSTHLPFFDYYVYHEAEDDYTHVQQVADEDMLTMCRAEYKYLSGRDKLNLFRMELESGVEKELLACMASFDGVPYYRPIYAPAFTHGEQLLIFDHPNSLLRVTDMEGTKIDSVAILYHRPEKIMNNHFEHLVQDEVTEEVYAFFQYPGGKACLDRVDITTGAADRCFTYTYDYPEAIQVRAGEVYYTYRPFESLQKKYLYKEELSPKESIASH
jgi:hypothetical protein